MDPSLGKWKKAWKVDPFCVCVCVLEWVRGGFEEVSMSMVDFFLSVWLQVRGGSGFLFPSSCSLPFGILVSILCTLVCPFARWS